MNNKKNIFYSTSNFLKKTKIKNINRGLEITRTKSSKNIRKNKSNENLEWKECERNKIKNIGKKKWNSSHNFELLIKCNKILFFKQKGSE